MRASLIKNLKGENGSNFIADTAAYTGNWDTIVALQAATAALVSDQIKGDLSAVPLPVGVPIYGRVTSITLASGKVMAYIAA